MENAPVTQCLRKKEVTTIFAAHFIEERELKCEWNELQWLRGESLFQENHIIPPPLF